MTIAHLSDTHLGFRAYGRVRPDGANVREADVLETFERTLGAMADRDPDLVVHAGDFFHVVRPSNLSLVGGYRAVEAFQKRRGGKPMVILGGNHDVPRAGSGGILGLFAGIPGVPRRRAGDDDPRPRLRAGRRRPERRAQGRADPA